jgi:hypothetical protein
MPEHDRGNATGVTDGGRRDAAGGMTDACQRVSQVSAARSPAQKPAQMM